MHNPSLHRNNSYNTKSDNSVHFFITGTKDFVRVTGFQMQKNYDVYLRCTKLSANQIV